MKKLNPLSWGIGALLFLACACRAAQAATITVDGSQTNQYVDGFGVNASYWSYTNSDLNPVLDALVEQAGMTLFRVVFNNGWETNNDNDDPNVLNQSYYNTLYAGPEFQKLWGLLAHLEQKGLSNGIVLNFQGPGPAWMGGNTVASGMEDEWAEMIVSLLLYARTNQHLNFHLVAPDNEPNIASEGIYVPTAAQYVTMLQKLAQKLDAYGLGDFRFVVPDRTDGSTNFFPEIMNTPAIMAKAAHFGMHSYGQGGEDTASVCALLDASQFRDRKVWVTEFNVWCQSCETGGQGTNDWRYFRETADYLLDHLNHGASAGIVWEGYDSFYPHHDAWSFWGLLAVNNTNALSKTYAPRKNFYTLSQISKFVRPGSRGIGLSGSSASSLKLAAFYNDDLGQVTLTGVNTGTGSVGLSGTLVSLPTLATMDLYYTSSTTNLARGSVQINSNTFSATIPGDCIFTLTGVDAAKLLFSVQLTSPAGETRFDPPANVVLEATATTSTGSVSRVEFFNGSAKLGEDIAPPYSLAWSNVPFGAYVLTARASNTVGLVATSGIVHITVPGPAAQIRVSPGSAITVPLGSQQFSASTLDAFGTLVQPQPAFAWSAGGGTVDSNGFFAAGAVTGTFAVTASGGTLTGSANIHIATNLASAGTGYTWYSLDSAIGNSPRATAAGINDGDLSTDVPLLPGGGVDNANAYEAAGIVWPAARTVRQIMYRNGSWTFDDNGVFAADFQLQFSSDGTTWTAAGAEWRVSPTYVYNSLLSANLEFAFQGGTNSIRGVRCAGRIHTSEAASPPNSWVANATEAEVYNVEIAPNPALLSATMLSNTVVISWPVSPESYVLEAAGLVNQTNAWSAVTNVPQQFGQEQRVMINPTEAQRFFRLRLQ